MALAVTLIAVNWVIIIGFSVYRYKQKKKEKAEAKENPEEKKVYSYFINLLGKQGRRRKTK